MLQNASLSSAVNGSTKPMLAPSCTHAWSSPPSSPTWLAMSSAEKTEITVCVSALMPPHTMKRMYLAPHASGVAKALGPKSW